MHRPRPISPDDALEDFDCGADDLNHWLKARAYGNELAGASRTFVIEQDGRVIGYYALTAGSILHADAAGNIRRNMPDPVPAAILARLAIDKAFQNDGLGREMLQDAVRRTISAAETLGVRAMMVHALSERARGFYETCGFKRSPTHDMTLMATLSDLRKAFS
ncbi:GNAT family N-acetyltransferase [Asticcacaulis sp. EMRT-3]|uniref:GNAT family N-acetyltransferase n=1 Tax=Asticcacaulis sp. EMRT-3 TaxID=3040349 RepID=UPI0024AFE846|nr:GNAT family N-acetyltransferase [Asticcacaulis sp. EMRT-3]MDI7774147.1 GNAT family N-acetyltransferase [Asticcacaulis sp. EMRT-3]